METTARAVIKGELRKAVKRLIASLSRGDKLTQSTAVANKVASLPEFEGARRIAFFLNMPDEVDTHAMLKTALAAGKECFVPRYTKTDMNMYKVRDLDDVATLPLTKWNIPQPEDIEARESAIDAGGLDAIIVPGLAFSPKGGRLGRGKGYYDAYIARCKEFPAKSGAPAPTLIAVGFDCQVIDDVPMEMHDQRMHHVVTPSQHIEVEKQ